MSRCWFDYLCKCWNDQEQIWLLTPYSAPFFLKMTPLYCQWAIGPLLQLSGMNISIVIETIDPFVISWCACSIYTSVRYGLGRAKEFSSQKCILSMLYTCSLTTPTLAQIGNLTCEQSLLFCCLCNLKAMTFNLWNCFQKFCICLIKKGLQLAKNICKEYYAMTLIISLCDLIITEVWSEWMQNRMWDLHSKHMLLFI